MRKILVVEDDQDIRDIVDLVLSADGFTIIQHATGLGVMEVVEAHQPDLILLDLTLPGRAGTELCKELKENYTIPVVLFTAHAHPEEPVAGCGADSYLAKPFNISDLVQTIKTHLDHSTKVF